MPTITQNGQYQDAAGIRFRRIAVYTGPASYVTGGDSFTASNASLGVMQGLFFAGNPTNGTAVRLLWWDRTNNKILWIVPETGAQVANATDLSAYSVVFEAVGK